VAFVQLSGVYGFMHLMTRKFVGVFVRFRAPLHQAVRYKLRRARPLTAWNLSLPGRAAVEAAPTGASTAGSFLFRQT
jgi:hypothetical protein